MTEPAATNRPRSIDETTLDEIPARPELPLPRWLAPLALVCVVALVPWIGYLAVTLPRRVSSDNYDLAWIGFDVGLWLVLLGLAVCAFRRSTATGPVAAVAATMLCVDAWFDVVTTHNRRELIVSIATAIVVELPLAAICTWVAINSERIRARAYRSLRLRLNRTARLAGETDERNPPVAIDDSGS